MFVSIKIFVVLALFVVSFVDGGILTNGRIVGGSDINISQAPYTVALLADNNGVGTYSHICGGAIISANRILTSAQCTNNLPVTLLRIRAGSSFHNSDGEVIQVITYIQHEQYNSLNYNNDISIVNLINSITFGTNAAAVVLAPQNATPLDGSTCTLTGWGRLSSGGVLPTNLQMVSMLTINQNICVSSYSGINDVTTGMICAGLQGIGDVGACQGDTGGPLVVGGLLYGLASWGRGCGEPTYPSVFTKTSVYTNWINSN